MRKKRTGKKKKKSLVKINFERENRKQTNKKKLSLEGKFN